MRYYRGTRKNGNRCITGNEVWDNNLFCSKEIKYAKVYGDDIEIIDTLDSARILVESDSYNGFTKIGIRHRNNEMLLDYYERVLIAARQKGYDIVEFKSQCDVGTVIMNESVVERNVIE